MSNLKEKIKLKAEERERKKEENLQREYLLEMGLIFVLAALNIRLMGLKAELAIEKTKAELAKKDPEGFKEYWEKETNNNGR